ncbi:hypothetical protein XENTR_v10006535 [Xenopus tropicalis]|nr:hypothetical protein XENTR_v10006535 [Xenopus tropicalis]
MCVVHISNYMLCSSNTYLILKSVFHCIFEFYQCLFHISIFPLSYKHFLSRLNISCVSKKFGWRRIGDQLEYILCRTFSLVFIKLSGLLKNY